jgi:putative flippase GtrA
MFSDGHFTVIQLQVQVIADEWVKMNYTINRIWSFTKETEKRVEGLYSDLMKVCLFRLSSIKFSLYKMSMCHKYRHCFGLVYYIILQYSLKLKTLFFFLNAQESCASLN